MLTKQEQIEFDLLEAEFGMSDQEQEELRQLDAIYGQEIPLEATQEPQEGRSVEGGAEVFPSIEDPTVDSEQLPERGTFGVPEQVDALQFFDQAVLEEERYLARQKDSTQLEEIMDKLKKMLPKESFMARAIDRILVGATVGNKLFDAVAVAETGGEEDPFVRTRFAPEEGSTAYGPVQITATLASDYLKRKSNLFTREEKDYLKRFLSQAKLFNKYGREPDKEGYDSRYDYGGSGDLTSDQDRALYRRVAEKMLADVYKRNNGNLDKTLKEWRFGASSKETLRSDPRYFKKIKLALGDTLK